MADEAIKTTEFEGDLAVERNITSGGGITSRDDGLFSKDLTVEGWLNAKNMKPVENLTVNNALDVLGTATLKNLVTSALAKLASLEVEGTADFKGASSFEGTATLKKLVVTTLAKLASLEVEGTSTFNGDTKFNGSTVFIGSTNIGGSSDGGSSGGASNLTSLVVSGATVLNTLITNGLATLAKLAVNGDASVQGNTTLNTLEVTALSKLASLIVSGDTNLTTLVTTGLAKLASLVVSGNTDLTTLVTTGLAKLASLEVEGTSTFNGNATFENLHVKGWSKLDGETVHSGDTRSTKFAEGFEAGYGWRIDKDGNAWLDSLSVRQFLEVPELRYNRATVIQGDEWQAPGGGVIETVTPDTGDDGNETTTGTITLHLEDGEIGAVAAGDLCVGYWHYEQGNSTADSDDLKGNIQHAGFTAVYFKITAVTDSSTRASLTYELRCASDSSWPSAAQPAAGMHFAVFGNTDDTTRQQSVLRTKTYTRHLAGVNWWELTELNIMMQLGDLSGLTINGESMEGYSAYLSNVYMSGTIKQLEDLPLRVEVTWTGGESLSEGDTATATARLMKGFTDVSAAVAGWKVTRESGDEPSDETWNAAHAYTETHGELSLTLSYSDIISGGTANTFTFTPLSESGTAEGKTLLTDSDGTTLLTDAEGSVIYV